MVQPEVYAWSERKKIKYGQMLIVESRLSVYEYSMYSFFNFFILY